MGRRRRQDLSGQFWTGTAIIVGLSVYSFLELVSGGGGNDRSRDFPSAAVAVAWPAALIITAACAAGAFALLWSWEVSLRRLAARRRQERRELKERRRQRRQKRRNQGGSTRRTGAER